jgi:hypothetical protein
MTTTKSLMLACLTALSLGVASANAQSLTPGAVEGAYFGAHNGAAATGINRANDLGQSGSTDPDPTWSGAHQGSTFLSNHHLFGVGGAGS